MIAVDVTNVNELRRITALELQGCIDVEGLKEFTKAFILALSLGLPARLEASWIPARLRSFRTLQVERSALKLCIVLWA